MNKNFLGNEIPKLGFGLMRLPMENDKIDLEQTKQMVDTYMQRGFTYFDTAYVYINGTSEIAAREAIVKRYPRESFQLATKLAIWPLKNPEDMLDMFNTSLERAGVDYFDFYLLHALNKDSAKRAEELGAWEFIAKQKEEGKIKHIGFSFHDSAEVLDSILQAHPESEFVQLQINYADWEDAGVQSRACYEVAMKHNKPVIIMEPIKGGSLVTMRDDISSPMKAYAPDASIASWALRFSASLDGIITVLSGMSNIEQLEDNTTSMQNYEKMNEEEYAIIDQVNTLLKAASSIPCTDCKYCVDDCPMNINIPGSFAVMNHYLSYNNLSAAKWSYNDSRKNRGSASECIACGSCESHCPQHIKIIDELKKIADTLEV